MGRMDVPQSLRRWFVAHFVVDITVAVPLLFAPQLLLSALGWSCVDPAAARLVGAALVGIGAQSFIGRNDGDGAYKAMLNLKILWSLSAIFGLVMAIGEGAPPAIGGFLAAFLVFSGVWIYYRVRFKQLAAATDEESEGG